MDNDINIFLEKQLESVNKWLSFAEAKNAAIIAFSGVMLKLAFDVYVKHNFDIWLIGAILLFTLSMLLSLISFLPSLTNKPEANESEEQIDENVNLLYFGDIARFSNEHVFIECIQKKYFDKDTTLIIDTRTIDLAKELIINSTIAVNKYQKFTWSLRCSIIGLLGVVISVLFSV